MPLNAPRLLPVTCNWLASPESTYLTYIPVQELTMNHSRVPAE